MPDREERIRELERELAELRSQRPRPLTISEVNAMSPEEVAREAARVKATLRETLGASDDRITHAGSRERLERAYAEGPDGWQRRHERRNDLPDLPAGGDRG